MFPTYHKIAFTVGYQGDPEVLDFGFFKATVGTGYQEVVNDQQRRILTLEGEEIKLPKFYSFDFLEVEAATPAWAPEIASPPPPPEIA